MPLWARRKPARPVQETLEMMALADGLARAEERQKAAAQLAGVKAFYEAQLAVYRAGTEKAQ